MNSPSLVLTLRNENAEVVETRVVEGEVLSIGRSPAAHWIVRDGRLSRIHCEIRRAEHGGYVIVDQSRNGVFRNASPTPLGRGTVVPLQHGDVIALGSHTLAVGFRPPPTDDATRLVEPRRDATRLAEPRSNPAQATTTSPPVVPTEGDPFFDPVLASPRGDTTGTERGSYAARAMGPSVDAAGAAAREPPAAPDNELLAAFLQGAGVTLPAGSPLSQVELMRNVGETFRAAVLGIREMLLVRSSMRSQLRLMHTVLRSTGNNSLKFALDDDHALQTLLSAPRPGSLRGPDAVRQSIQDLAAHEQMMMDLMKAGQDWIFDQLAPDEIRSLVQRSGLHASVVPGLRKARYWDEYERAYNTLKQSLEADAAAGGLAALKHAYDGTVSKQ
jgi:type VI secretion system FHA domain protein